MENDMKKNIRSILICLLTVSMLFLTASCGKEPEPEPERTAGWLSSDGTFIQLYHGDEIIEKNFFGKVKSRTLELSEDISVPRGTEVILIDQPEKDEEGNVTYEKIAILVPVEHEEEPGDREVQTNTENSEVPEGSGSAETPEGSESSETPESPEGGETPEEPEGGETPEEPEETVEMQEVIYYVEPGYFVDDFQKTITETEKYVRTSATVYETADSPKIAGWAKKGTHLEITGFDRFEGDDHVKVNMYKVKYDETEGYVFAKYLVDTEEEAKAVYNEKVNGKGVYDWHKNAVYSYFELYGGSPKKLDYYPVEKVEFEDNKLLKDARTMRISMYCADYADDFVQCAKDTKVNAVCIDLFDGALAYKSDVAKELCPSAYKKTYASSDKFEKMVKKFKDAGFYVIGRIVVFKDDYYAKDHPEDCYRDYDGGLWPSAYNRDVWYYKVSLALEAIDKFGLNEVQFDYVRFDEFAWYKPEYGDKNFNSTYGEGKCEAVKGFLFYACDMIHQKHAYVSVDVFGECSSGYVTSYGQYWPAMSNVVDVISSMPYTDHFSFNDADSYLWENPDNTVYNWAVGAASQQKTIPTPAIARTWITGYDVPYWRQDIYCGPDYLAAQAQALWDAGLTGGFIPWGQCEGWRYYAFSWAWTKKYAR